MLFKEYLYLEVRHASLFIEIYQADQCIAMAKFYDRHYKVEAASKNEAVQGILSSIKDCDLNEY